MYMIFGNTLYTQLQKALIFKLALKNIFFSMPYK